MTKRPQTIDQFEIHTIMPAAGWRAVFFDDTAHAHFLLPVHALALVSRFTYEVGTKKLHYGPEERGPDTLREIVGMSYSFGDGWDIIESMINVCGLLPPGKELQDFEYGKGCWHAIHTMAKREEDPTS